MRSLLLCGMSLVLLLGPAAVAQDSPGESTLTVSRIGVGTDVEDRELQFEASSFAADIGQLACLTRIEAAEGDTHVTHVWLQDGEERWRIDLGVRSSSWRTWSKKSVTAGEWTVRVLDPDGTEISSISVTVGP